MLTETFVQSERERVSAALCLRMRSSGRLDLRELSMHVSATPVRAMVV